MTESEGIAACVLAVTDGEDVVGFASPESGRSVDLLRESARRAARDRNVAVRCGHDRDRTRTGPVHAIVRLALAGVVACVLAPAAALGTSPRPSSTRAIILRPGEPWVAYQDGGRIRLVRPDGTGDHPLVPTPTGGQAHPDWSPDGSRIAFDSEGTALWIADATGSHMQRIYPCNDPCQYVQDPAWAPDGKHIAFVRADLSASGTRTARARLLVLDLHSHTTRTVVTFRNGIDTPFAPRFAPDGKRVVFELDRFADAKTSTTEITGARIGIARVDGTGGVRYLTAFSAIAATPDWHPTRPKIVFAAGSRGIPDHSEDAANLFTVDPNGRNLVQLTHYAPPGQRAVQPTWTPDGARIIFTYVRGTGFGEPVSATVAAAGGDLQAPPPGSPTRTHPRLRP